MPSSATSPPALDTEFFDRFVAESHEGDFDAAYYLAHRLRFQKTLDYIPISDGSGHAVELGATNFLQILLKRRYGYRTVSGTQISGNIEEKIHRKTFTMDDFQTENLIASIDLENELLPFAVGSIDLVMCCELIEHLDIDPMFMLSEINRVSKTGAHLVITTPNCCSARNFWKIAHGYRPHFFMQYEKSRSPYRHNIEYDVPTIVTLVTAAGFEIEQVDTFDVFEAELPQAIELLKVNNLPLDYRGDGIFLLARKISEVRDRWPCGIYV